MHLKPIERVTQLTPEEFRNRFFLPQRPVIFTELSKNWPAICKWDWRYLKSSLGKLEVGVHSNRPVVARMPSGAAADVMRFSDYVDLIGKGPVALRIFRLNIQKLAPQLAQDFSFPEQFALSFLKQSPLLFAGGAGAIAHMHFDRDRSHIFHTHFLGRKRVLLLPPSQSALIYQLPFTDESAASFAGWEYELDEENFPALSGAKGFEAILNHGETLFMPSAYWHHMQYMDCGFALSLLAGTETYSGKLNGLYEQAIAQPLNEVMMRLAPDWWFEMKQKLAVQHARKALK